MKKLFSIAIVLVLSVILVSCSDGMGGYYNYDARHDGESPTGDEHQIIKENPFVNADVNNKSNISLSSNTAAYSFIRSQINAGLTVSKDAVRIEEMVNFFSYDYNEPDSDDVFGLKSELIETPWNSETHLLVVGLQTKKMDLGDVATNLVVLLDVSGSMSSGNKLPMVKASMKILLEQMKPQDKISLVTYSSGEKIVFKGKTISDYDDIVRDIDKLVASGATAGQKGLKMAYEVAEEFFIEGGNNRIVLATDGDFNVGISSTDALIEYISDKRQTGIYFSAFGYGYGNYKDEKLERIAKAGNGVYHYIDDMLSARKAFVDNIDGLLYTVARDAKAQIEFNKDAILEYRLIGYENRQLTDEEFEDETTDAGEIGTGLQVTAIYEVKLKETPAADLASLTVRYKSHDVKDETQLEDQFTLSSAVNLTPSVDANFIASIVEFGLILIDSDYKAEANISSVLERIEHEPFNKEDYYRSDFIDILKKYAIIAAD